MLFLDLPKRTQAHPPVCVIGGAKDKLFMPVSQMAMARHYDADYHILEDAPHNIMMSKHGIMAAQTFLSWMKRLS